MRTSVVLLLGVGISGASFGQVVDNYYSYSLPNCPGQLSELHLPSKQAMCNEIADRYVKTMQCTDDPASHPDYTLTVEPIEHWILDRDVPSPSACFVRFQWTRHFGPPFNTSDSHEVYIDGGGGGISMYPVVLRMFVSTQVQPGGECGSSCNGISDPINPVSGAVYSTTVDLAGEGGSMEFKRFYDSRDAGASVLSTRWRHSFSRSIRALSRGFPKELYTQSNSQSSLYDTASGACVSGFLQIKSKVPEWSSATAEYLNGVCSLRVGTTSIGSLPILYDSAGLAPGTSEPIAYEVTRDDGRVIRFTGISGSLVPPPGTAMNVQKTGAGFELRDEKNSTERYDSNGRLLSVTSLAGLVQTMGYDILGRLSTVTDSFGHQLTLTYDSQGRLSAVVRQ